MGVNWVLRKLEGGEGKIFESIISAEVDPGCQGEGRFSTIFRENNGETTTLEAVYREEIGGGRKRGSLQFLPKEISLLRYRGGGGKGDIICASMTGGLKHNGYHPKAEDGSQVGNLQHRLGEKGVRRGACWG